ncbi:MAG: PKD domain-containing protein [Bacteroidetes bacterium]|nr:MAG: PKD domain-containing protein [Bacteroidota bacterium]
MIKKILFLSILCLIFSSPYLFGQACTILGQNPSTAFPVCGTDTFSQITVPICGTKTIPVPCNDGAPYYDKNPFWYKFTCFQAGTLGLLITPNNLQDDYDWQLFDITGHDPNDIYSQANLFIVGNWSAEAGLTGASNAGTSAIECAGYGHSPFSKMPVLQQNHNYLLLISHFTDTQSGYSLSFGGGTASITDPTNPKLASAIATCDASILTLKLNKKMKCSTLAADGSDFTIFPAVATVVGAVATSCTSGFDMDSITIHLSAPLPIGNYTLSIKNGSDGNTLLDNCNRNVPVGDNVPFVISPVAPTPMDSITPVACSPSTLQLVFKKKMKCSSIAADGSDFTITGPYPVTISGAAGTCSNDLSSTITIQLSSPIVNKGVYTITLKNGSDGNTIFDECAQQTPAGSSLNFNAVDTVSANFTYQIYFGCKRDTIAFAHDGRNDVNSWNWTFDNGATSNLQNPQMIYSIFGLKQATLVVSNGVCKDSVSATIDLNNTLKSIFETSSVVCPNDSALFRDHSIGNITQWNWDFGNGSNSNVQNPPAQQYPTALTDKTFPVTLIVRDNIGCADTSLQQIKVVASCYIAIPSAFTPNGDGLNDYLYPLNAYKADNLIFKVYNRFGQEVFSTTDWTKKWDGTINGKPQSTGTYVWFLQYTHRDTGKQYNLKGSTILIR